MSSLNELHKIAVETAEALRTAQVATAAERTEENDYVASKTTRQAEKAAHKAHHTAMMAFQNAVEEIGAENVPNLADMYAQIGQVKL